MTSKKKDAAASSPLKSILYRADASNREEVAAFIVQNGFSLLRFGEILSGATTREFPLHPERHPLGVSFALSPGDILEIRPDTPTERTYMANHRKFKVISE